MPSLLSSPKTTKFLLNSSILNNFFTLFNKFGYFDFKGLQKSKSVCSYKKSIKINMLQSLIKKLPLFNS